MQINMSVVIKIAFLLTLSGLWQTVQAASNDYRDPTKPWNYQATKAEVTDKSLNLTGIRIEQGKRIAYINGKPYQQGAYIAGYKLLKIEQSYVLLANQSTQRKLNLVSSLVRKTQ